MIHKIPIAQYFESKIMWLRELIEIHLHWKFQRNRSSRSWYVATFGSHTLGEIVICRASHNMLLKIRGSLIFKTVVKEWHASPSFLSCISSLTVLFLRMSHVLVFFLFCSSYTFGCLLLSLSYLVSSFLVSYEMSHEIYLMILWTFRKVLCFTVLYIAPLFLQ